MASQAHNPGEDQVKPWENPLTTDDIRQRAAKWTLADDSQLLAYLQSTSDKIICRAREVGKDLDGLVHEATVSGVKVNNVVNDFNLLSSLQFIENRVYDEEIKEGEAQIDSAPLSKEEQEAALMTRVAEACQLGIGVVRSALEPLDLPAEADSDESDEEGGAPAKQRALSPIFRSKDPYLDRPLPHLIGSQAFVDDDYVGLGDLLAEDDEKSSRGEYESDKSDSELDEEDEGKMAPPDSYISEMMQREFGGEEEDSEEEELFEEKVPRKATKVSTSSSELHSEEDEFLPSSTTLATAKRESLSSRKSVDAASEMKQEGKELFSEPVEYQHSDDEQSSLFKPKRGTFSGPGKLFDDEEEEGDLFKTETARKKEEEPTIRTPKHTGYTESGKKIPAGGVSMLGGGGQPLFQAIARLNSNPHSKDDEDKDDPSSTVKAPTRPGHENSEEKPATSQAKKVKKEEKKALGSVKGTNEEEDDLFSVPVARKAPQTKGDAPTPSSKLFDADDDDDDLWFTNPSKMQDWGKIQKEKDEIVKPPLAASNKAVVPVPTVGGLFDDDADDLFSSSSGKKTEPKKSTKSFPFDDDEEEIFTGSLQTKDVVAPTKKPIFTDSTDSDDLFSTNAKTPAAKAPYKGLFLFEDEEDDKLKTTSSTQASKEPSLPPTQAEPAVETRPRKSISLFDEDEGDEDLFSTKTKEMADSQSSHSVQSSTWSSESKENTEPSPARQESSEPAQPLKARTSSHFLFHEDDKLFENASEDSPDVDLFASDQTDTGKGVERKKPVGGVLPFGGDLFGAELKSKLGKSVKSQGDSSDSKVLETESHSTSSSPSHIVQKKGAPLLKDTREGSVSFDEPADKGSTLVSATKDRAKIQTKRRLPSRVRRRSNIPPDSPDGSSTREESPLATESAVAEIAVQQADDILKSSSSRSVPHASMVKSPSTEEEDLFAVMENTLKPVPEPAKAPKARDTAQTKAQLRLEDEDEGDDLFSPAHKGATAAAGGGPLSSRPKATLSSIGDDLFLSNKATVSDDIFADSSVGNVDALFGSGDSQPASAKTDAKLLTSVFEDENATVDDVLDQPPAKKHDIFENDYDIFSSPTSKPALKSRTRTSLFGDDNDDTDDIFASKPAPKAAVQVSQKPSSSLKSATSQSVDFKDPLLHGEDDD